MYRLVIFSFSLITACSITSSTEQLVWGTWTWEIEDPAKEYLYSGHINFYENGKYTIGWTSLADGRSIGIPDTGQTENWAITKDLCIQRFPKASLTHLINFNNHLCDMKLHVSDEGVWTLIMWDEILLEYIYLNKESG